MPYSTNDDKVNPGPDTLSEWTRKNPDTGQSESKLWLEGDAAKAESEGWKKKTGMNEQEKVDKQLEQAQKPIEKYQEKVEKRQEKEAEVEAKERQKRRDEARK